jgi:hypothetical protein
MLARWISSDTIEKANLFAYAGNNPITSMDPSGMDWVKYSWFEFKLKDAKGNLVGTRAIHIGLVVNVNNKYWGINAYPSTNDPFNSNLRVSVDPLPGGHFPGHTEEYVPITAKHEDACAVLSGAWDLQKYFLTHDVKYTAWSLAAAGTNSNQVASELLRRNDIRFQADPFAVAGYYAPDFGTSTNAF